MPKNLQAILDWCKEHRPDLVDYIEKLKNDNGVILLLTVGFESGRQFQRSNPEVPINQPHLYLS